MLSLSAQSEVNLRVSPVSLLLGTASVTLDIPVSEAWTLGPTASFTDTTSDGFDVNGYSAGIRGNYFFSGKALDNSWYFGPSLNYAYVEVEEDFGGSIGMIKDRGNGIDLSALFGYQWFWDHFNMGVGLGPSYTTVGDIKVKNKQNNTSETYSGSDGIGLDAEFTLGWKF